MRGTQYGEVVEITDEIIGVSQLLSGLSKGLHEWSCMGK